MEQEEIVWNGVQEIGQTWMTVLFPRVDALLVSVGSASEMLLKSKLYRVLQCDTDIMQWLKDAECFQKSNPHYRRNVTNLIYTIDAIREEEALDIYANLLHAWKQNLIDRDTFFRLAWCLSQIYSADLWQLEGFYMVKKKVSGASMLTLYNLGLLTGKPNAVAGVGTVIEAWLSKSGLEMLRCGLCFDKYNEFKDFDPKIIKAAL